MLTDHMQAPDETRRDYFTRTIVIAWLNGHLWGSRKDYDDARRREVVKEARAWADSLIAVLDEPQDSGGEPINPANAIG